MNREIIDLASSGQLIREATPEVSQYQELDPLEADKAIVWHAAVARLRVAEKDPCGWPADLFKNWIYTKSIKGTEPEELQIQSKHWNMTMRGPGGPVTIQSDHAIAPSIDEAQTREILWGDEHPIKVPSLNDMVNLIKESRYGMDIQWAAQERWSSLQSFMAYKAKWVRDRLESDPEYFGGPSFEYQPTAPGPNQPMPNMSNVPIRIGSLLTKAGLVVADQDRDRLEAILQSIEPKWNSTGIADPWRKLVLKMIAKTYPDLSPGNEDLCKILTHLLSKLDEDRLT